MRISKKKLNISVGKLYKNSFTNSKHSIGAGVTSASFSIPPMNSLLIQIRNRNPEARVSKNSLIKALVGDFSRSQRQIKKKKSSVSRSIRTQLESARSELKWTESLQQSISSEIVTLQDSVEKYAYSIEKKKTLLGILKANLFQKKIQESSSHKQGFFDMSDQNVELSRAYIQEKSEGAKLLLQQYTCKHDRSLLAMRNSIMGDQLTSLLLTQKSLRNLKQGLSEIAYHGRDLIVDLLKSQKSRVHAFDMLDSINSKILCINTSKSGERSSIIEEIKKKITESRLIEERLKSKIKHTNSDLNANKEKLKAYMLQHNNLLAVYIEMKHKIKKIYEQNSRAVVEYKEQFCKFCKNLFWEEENLNWSCCFHPSNWNGNMYWCCGKTDINHPGCLQNKHISKEEDELIDVFMSGQYSQISCSSCKQIGHTYKECPNDPNIKVKRKKKFKKVYVKSMFIDKVIREEDEEDEEDLVSIRSELSLKKFFSSLKRVR